MFKRKRIVEYSFIVVGLLLFVFFAAKAMAQNVTQGYQTDTTLQQGMIVRLVPGASNKVEALSQDSSTDMLGVVVAASDAPVAISDNNNQAQTYVATYGQYDVLVSNENGTIKAGDTVTISSVDGVGMKAGNSQKEVLGKAMGSFDGKTDTQTSQVLQTSDGKKTVAIGRIQVNISIAHNPAYKETSTNTNGVPKFLQPAIQIITDKPVGAIRVYASLLVLFLAMLIAGVILYAGVRTGLTAIGRNPLAKSSIVRNLIQVILVALIIVLVGLIAVYLLLKL